jgi:hypothetical protein
LADGGRLSTAYVIVNCLCNWEAPLSTPKAYKVKESTCR